MISIAKQLEYIHNLKYIYIGSNEVYNKLTKKISSLYILSKCNINKLPNTLIKLSYCNKNNLNNLPLNLKYLICYSSSCNLPPQLLYLRVEYYDIHNLPRSLQFIYIYNKNIKLPYELIDTNYNKNKILYFYNYNIIKLKSIY